MADAFYGEIRAFAFQFSPVNWCECRGQQVSIQQFQALYAILAWRYGGDQKTYFNVPDLRGKAAIATGSAPDTGTVSLAQNLGVDTVTLNLTQTPVHNHSLNGYGTPTVSKIVATPTATTTVFSPLNTSITPSPRYPGYNATASLTGNMDQSILAYDGGVASPAPHDNHQPYLPLRYFICTTDAYWPENPNA